MEMLDDRLPEMIAKIEDGSEYALLLAPASNVMSAREARCIIRKIAVTGNDAYSPAELQLAYHELYAGRAGSGIYGSAAYISETARRVAESFSTSHLYKSFYKDKGFRWVFAREVDLPANLIA
jgi:hypothetical protein